MVDLSAVIITKNEEKRIQRCLESIRWIPEIIVVDDESCDQTISICERYTDKVVVHPLNGDFASQRNIGIEKATKRWVLQLDADEVVPPHSQRILEQALSQQTDSVAFSLIRTNFFLGRRMRFGGWNERSVKLFCKGKAYYEGRVHECLKIEGTAKLLNAEIEHYPFETFSDCLKKVNRYSSLEAQMMMEKNPSISLKECRYQMTIKALKVFWKVFVKKQGFREGIVGLVFAWFWALGHFMKWAKYWELSQDASRS